MPNSPTMAVAGDPNARGQQLKAEANALYAKRQYAAAHFKYSEAIKEDQTNAILYANRAATSLAMKEFLDAALDARKAVTIDPGYSKAWARLATASLALSSYEKSIDAWEKALASLPSENLSPSEKVLKAQYDAGLASSREAQSKPLDKEKLIGMAETNGCQANLPWNKALAMEKVLSETQDYSSSAWVIMNAYRDFQTGVKVMKQTKTRMENGKVHWEGVPNALTSISNGILRDVRVFHMDSRDWPDLYNEQVKFEGFSKDGWIEGGAKTVQEEALARLKTAGWGPVSRALAVTIRAWVMRGFLQSSATAAYTTALEFYQRAVDVLEWGRRVWKNVSREDRGVIFEDTFVRGVKRLLMSCLLEACHPDSANSSEYSIEDLAAMAHDMIAEITSNPPRAGGVYDHGFILSFWTYAKAEALSVLGFYHMQTARRLDDFQQSQEHYENAAHYYVAAGSTYPEDDEKRPYFLKIGLEALWWQNAPLRETLPLCKRIRMAIPKMTTIWGTSQMSSHRDESLQEALNFEVECQKGILEGQYTLDDMARPSFMESSSENVEIKEPIT